MDKKNLDNGGIRRKSLIIRRIVSFGLLAIAWHSSAPERFYRECVELSRPALTANHLIPVRFPVESIKFQATAYCESGITKSGVPTAPGIAAADLSVLPIGSVIHVEGATYWGVYRIMDTGRLVKGKIIDIYLPTLEAALNFGRQEVQVRVLQYGSPKQKILSYSE